MSDEDVEIVHNGLESDDKEQFLDLLATRSTEDRLSILTAYNTKYQGDLLKDIDKKLSGDFKDLVILLFKDPIDNDCEALYKAMKGAGTNEETLVEILSSRNATMLNKIIPRFKELYNEELSVWVKDETSGTFQTLMLNLLNGARGKNKSPTQEEVENWAQKFNDFVEKKEKDESILNEIFIMRSGKELLLISREYHKKFGKTMNEAIDALSGSDLKLLLHAIIYVQISPSEYFATRLNKSMKGAGTNEMLLNRIILNRRGIDLDKIAKYYQKLYNQDLVATVTDETSKDYQKLLLKFLEEIK